MVTPRIPTAVRHVVSTILVALALGGSGDLAIAAAAHPLHTTLTELTLRPAERLVTASVRVFADDLALGMRDTRGDAATFSYVARHFVLRDANGGALSWTSCGVRRQDDLVWICLRAAAPAALTGAELRADVLCEVHADQVNVVRVTSPAARRTLLFTRGEPRQRLP